MSQLEHVLEFWAGVPQGPAATLKKEGAPASLAGSQPVTQLVPTMKNGKGH